MSQFRTVFWSSVGKKILTGLTGLALILFLVVHLLGNLLIYFGPDAFNGYAPFLESIYGGWFVVAFEFSRMLSVALLAFVTAFIFLGLWLDFLSSVFGWLKVVNPVASAAFFFFIFILFTVIFVLVFLQTRFNYWVVGG